MPTVTERVEAGVQLLNRSVEDWPNKIDVEAINIDSTVDCVLGQIYGRYGIGKYVLCLTTTDAIRHGFSYSTLERSILNDAWKEKIRELQAA